MKIGFLGIACLFSQIAFAWDGPSQSIGSGLFNLAHPTSFASAGESSGTNGVSPSQLKARGNIVLQKDAADTWQIQIKAESLNNPSPIQLGNGFANVPASLNSLELSLNFGRKIDGNDSWGLIGGIGSTSDILFNSFSELDISLTGVYTHRQDALHAWSFFINESTARSFLPGVPLPGAGYLVIDPVNNLTVFYGIPFFLNWHWAPQWNLTISYFVLTALRADVSMYVSRSTRIFALAEWTPQAWMRANRSDSTTRLIFDRKAVSVGAGSNFSDSWYLKAQIGYAFDQRWTEASSISSASAIYTYLPNGVCAELEISRQF